MNVSNMTENSRLLPEVTGPQEVSDQTMVPYLQEMSIGFFSKLNEEQLGEIYHAIESKTWQPKEKLSRGQEAEIFFHADYLRETVGEGVSASEFFSHLGESIEPVPSIFRPFASKMLSMNNVPINANRINLSKEPFGVVSEIPQPENLETFLQIMHREGVSHITSLASEEEIGSIPYWISANEVPKSDPSKFDFYFDSEMKSSSLSRGCFRILERGREVKQIHFHKIDPNSSSKHEDSWDLVKHMKETSEKRGRNPNPQVWVHCKVGLARSIAFKLIERFVSLLFQDGLEARVNVVDMIVQIRKERPGIFPYQPAFIEVCQFLQKKCVEESHNLAFQSALRDRSARWNCLGCCGNSCTLV